MRKVCKTSRGSELGNVGVLCKIGKAGKACKIRGRWGGEMGHSKVR